MATTSFTTFIKFLATVLLLLFLMNGAGIIYFLHRIRTGNLIFVVAESNEGWREKPVIVRNELRMREPQAISTLKELPQD